MYSDKSLLYMTFHPYAAQKAYMDRDLLPNKERFFSTSDGQSVRTYIPPHPLLFLSYLIADVLITRKNNFFFQF